jgi:hypothetical protein
MVTISSLLFGLREAHAPAIVCDVHSSIISARMDPNFGTVIILTLGCALQSVVAGWLLPRLLKPVVE